MELLPPLLRVYQCEDPAHGFRALVEALQGLPLHCAISIRSSDQQIRDAKAELHSEIGRDRFGRPLPDAAPGKRLRPL